MWKAAQLKFMKCDLRYFLTQSFTDMQSKIFSCSLLFMTVHILFFSSRAVPWSGSKSDFMENYIIRGEDKYGSY